MLMCLSLLLAGCSGGTPAAYPEINRADSLPADILKRGPQSDPYPPILHIDGYETPVPLPGPVNTAGAEDSPFILPDGRTLYFFFTPDVRVPAERQLLDGVTGVYVSQWLDGAWSEPERVRLEPPGMLSLDGAVAVQGDEMWFATAREGFTGVNIFTAEWIDGAWTNWRYAGDRLMKEIRIGEVHLHGDDLYFHSDRAGGLGGFDLWVTTRSGNDWSDPVALTALNSAELDGFPFVSSDGSELWFTRNYLGTPAIFRSLWADGTWGPPELIISQFAGEPTLDDDGNLYFVHHYFEDGMMIEADIYVAYRKP